MLHLHLSGCLAGTMADSSHPAKPRLYCNYLLWVTMSTSPCPQQAKELEVAEVLKRLDSWVRGGLLTYFTERQVTRYLSACPCGMLQYKEQVQKWHPSRPGSSLLEFQTPELWDRGIPDLSWALISSSVTERENSKDYQGQKAHSLKWRERPKMIT